MVHPKDDVAKRDKGALRIASTTILTPLSFAVAFIIENTFWKPGHRHVLAPRQVRPDFLIENVRRTPFSHPSQYSTHFSNAVSEFDKSCQYKMRVLRPHSSHCIHHHRDHLCSMCLDCNRNQIEPFLILSTGESMQSLEILYPT